MLCPLSYRGKRGDGGIRTPETTGLQPAPLTTWVRRQSFDVSVSDEMTVAFRVAQRFMAFKYQPKEKKTSKVERLTKLIREKTGLSRSIAEGIADAVVRGRDLSALALQKGWPVEDDALEGPQGSLTIQALRAEL